MAVAINNNNAPAKLPRPKILQWNCNSLRPRHAELCAHLSTQDFDVVCLQETYCQPSELKLPGYAGYHSATSCLESWTLAAVPPNIRNSPCTALRATTWSARG